MGQKRPFASDSCSGQNSFPNFSCPGWTPPPSPAAGPGKQSRWLLGPECRAQPRAEVRPAGKDTSVPAHPRRAGPKDRVSREGTSPPRLMPALPAQRPCLPCPLAAVHFARPRASGQAPVGVGAARAARRGLSQGPERASCPPSLPPPHSPAAGPPYPSTARLGSLGPGRKGARQRQGLHCGWVEGGGCLLCPVGQMSQTGTNIPPRDWGPATGPAGSLWRAPRPGPLGRKEGAHGPGTGETRTRPA